VTVGASIMLLMAENAGTGFVWQHFMKNGAADRRLMRAGFHSE
jgi:hypothetical protein